jgi:AcrR family transcriptional regulator
MPRPATGQRVRDAAVELFAERGYHGVGIRELAERAGLSSATLYHYMATKQDLLVAIMTENLEALIESAQAAVIGAGADPAGQLRALVELHVCEHARKPLETSVVDGEVRSLVEPHRAEILALRDHYESIWAQVLTAGRRTGAFAVEDPTVTRMALLEMCTGVSRWYRAGGKLSLSAVVERHVTLALALVEDHTARQ